MAKEIRNVSEILRSATARQPVRIPIAKVEIIPQNNVREPDIATWDIPGIAESLAMEGQLEPAVLQKVGEKYLPWRGFRRCSGVKHNAERGIVDPATGKPFDSVLAFVIDEELSIKDQYALLIDGGNTRLLNKVEVFYAAEKAKDVWDTDAQIAIALRGLLDLQFPVKDPEVLNDNAKYADYRRGVVQNLLAAARSPIVLRDTYVLKLKGKQKWPNEKEVRMLYSAFRKEADADKSNKINRQKPGKEWMKTWNEFVTKKKADATAGTKPKSLAMMSGDEVGTAKANCESRIVKTLMDIVKRNISQEHLATLDALLVDVENGKATTEEIGAVLDSITPPTASEEEAGE